jgi:hypothetical protein
VDAIAGSVKVAGRHQTVSVALCHCVEGFFYVYSVHG